MSGRKKKLVQGHLYANGELTATEPVRVTVVIYLTASA